MDFQASAAAAKTGHAAEGIDTHVSDLGGRVVDSTPQFPVQNYSPADACSQRYTDDGAAAVARSLPHLAHCRGVRVVFEDGWQLQLACQRRSQTKSIQTCHV